MSEKVAKPPVKWAGGKRQLLKHIVPLVDKPGKYGTYFEPFVGGGAVFFALHARQKFVNAFLNDANQELMDLYWALSRSASHLVQRVRHLLDSHPISEESFLHVREWSPTTPYDKAARFLYLNKTAYNGLYRVSKSGKFNAPYGRWPEDKLPTVLDADNLVACGKALQSATLSSFDFEQAVSNATAGDLVYFDPPYVPVKADSFGNGYTKGGFSFADQQRLAALFTSLSERGVGVVASNSDTPLTRELYAGHRLIEVQARRAINSKGDGRGPVGELIILGG